MNLAQCISLVIQRAWVCSAGDWHGSAGFKIRRTKWCVFSTEWCAGDTQEGYYQPLEKAEVVREGGDVTILCYSRMRYVVMQAVQTLEKQGFDPEVSSYCLVCQNALWRSPHSDSCAQGCTVIALCPVPCLSSFLLLDWKTC